MPTFTDDLGLEYTAGDAESLAGFNDVLETYLASGKAVMPKLEAVMERDPDMPMASLLRGYLLKLAADMRFRAPLEKIVRELERIKPSLTRREARHVDALAAWARDDLDQTAARLEALLDEYPKDMMALRVAHYLHFYAGGSAEMRDSVARSTNANLFTVTFSGCTPSASKRPASPTLRNWRVGARWI